MPDSDLQSPVGVLVVTGGGAGTPAWGAREVAEHRRLRERMAPPRFDAYRRGRATAHAALSRWLPGSAGRGVEVLRGPSSQPLATRADAGVAEVSIAHSAAWAAAVAAQWGRPVGVDLEERIGAGAHAAVRGTSSTERALAEAAGAREADAALVVWTAREAVAKALRTGLVIDAEVLDLAAVDAVSGGTVEVRYRRLPGFSCLAMVLDDVVMSVAVQCRRVPWPMQLRESTTTRATHRVWELVVSTSREG